MGKREQVLQLYSSKGCYEIHYPRWPTCNPTLTITRHQYMYFCHRQAKACDTRLLLLAWAGWGLGMRLTERGGEGEMNKLEVLLCYTVFYWLPEQDELEALAKTLPGVESLKEFKMHPQDFEKVYTCIIRLTNQKLSILDIFSFQTWSGNET